MDISVEVNPQKEKFIKRNMQVFQMALGLAILFLTLIVISLFLEKTEPTLVPVEEYENGYNY